MSALSPRPRPAARARAPRRERVYRALEQAGDPMSSGELARVLGVHNNTVRFHLSTLIEEGRVETSSAPRSTPGRPARLYRAVPGMDPNGPRAYGLLASLLVGDMVARPDGAERARSLGRQWGANLAGEQGLNSPAELVERLHDLMAGVGFAPGPVERADEHDDRDDLHEPSPDEGRYRLTAHNCPFLELTTLELTTEQMPIVCSIHLGMMEGAAQAWGGPGRTIGLIPFATPQTCVVEIDRARA